MQHPRAEKAVELLKGFRYCVYVGMCIELDCFSPDQRIKYSQSLVMTDIHIHPSLFNKKLWDCHETLILLLQYFTTVHVYKLQYSRYMVFQDTSNNAMALQLQKYIFATK